MNQIELDILVCWCAIILTVLFSCQFIYSINHYIDLKNYHQFCKNDDSLYCQTLTKKIKKYETQTQ